MRNQPKCDYDDYLRENAVKDSIKVPLSQLGFVIFHNSRGTGWVGRFLKKVGNVIYLLGARAISFGLQCPGSSDFIGWYSLEITPEMVGKKIAVFVALEAKREKGGKVEPEQQHFVDRVSEDGGIAGIIRGVDDAVQILKEFLCRIKTFTT